MTGSTAPVRLILREPPHLPFIQGWPGIPPSDKRQAATVQGAVEVRTNAAVKAKWVRVEIRKYEAVPTVSVAKNAFQNSWEHIGKVHVLWRAAEGKDWDMLNSADFRFVIPLPQDMPPSVELSKISGIRYELVASVCYKGKGGLFRKDPSTVTSVNQALRIVKYDLASAWPMYNQPDQRTATGAGGQLTLIVDRVTQAFGPGDRMMITVTVGSKMAQPFKVKTIELVLTEILTILPPIPDPNAKPSKKVKAPQPPTIKRQTVAQMRSSVGEVLGYERETKGSLDLVVPIDRPLLTVRAKEFRLEYELSVEAVLETNPSKISVTGIPCIIGTFSKSSAQQAVKDIGYVEGFCPRPTTTPQPSQTSATFPTTGSDRGQSAPGQRLGMTHSTSGLLSADGAGSSQRLQGMTAPIPTSSPAFNSSPPSSPPRQAENRRQIEGFTPRMDRRSSSGTTVTTASVATVDPYFDRGSMTLPNRRASHSPNINGAAGLSPEPAHRRTFDESSGLSGSLRHRGSSQSDAGHGRPPPGNSFAAWNSPGFECIMDSEEGSPVNAQSTSGHSRHPSRDSSMSHFSSVPEERVRASHISSQSPNLPDIVDEPHGLPPEYAPPSNHRATSPSARGSSATAAAATSAFAAAAAAGPSNGSHPPIPKEFMDATQEKEAQRRRYEEAQRSVNPSSPTSQGSNGYQSPQATGSGSGYTRMTSPSTTSRNTTPVPSQPHADEPIPYDDLFRDSPGPAPAQQFTPQHQRQMSNAAQSSSQAAKVEPNNAPPALSAEDEKDLVKQRYDAAQAGVRRYQDSFDDPELMGPAPAPLTILPPGVKGVGLGLPSMGSVSNSMAGPSNGPPPIAEEYISAAQEKELMRRRYEEAQNRVVSGSRDSTRADSPYNQAASSSSRAPAAPAGYISALEEKELMRQRYEQATQGAYLGSPSPPSSPPGSSSRVGGGSMNGNAGSSRGMSQEYVSAAEEKEMMRRRYEEAQNRVGGVSGASRAPSGPISYDQAVGGSSSAPSGSSHQRQPSLTPANYMSAEQEKEMMRKRYEDAQHAVARAAGVESPDRAASSSMHSNRPMDEPIPYDAIFPDGPSGSSSSKPAKAPSAEYMSAADEKEMMRKRYQDAQHRVARAAGSASPPPSQYVSSPTTMSSGAMSGTRDSPGYMSAEQEKDLMRRRYEEATNAVRRADDSDHGHGRRANTDLGGGSSGHRPMQSITRATSSFPDGAPPPLAPRPPREYIERI